MEGSAAITRACIERETEELRAKADSDMFPKAIEVHLTCPFGWIRLITDTQGLHNVGAGKHTRRAVVLSLDVAK